MMASCHTSQCHPILRSLLPTVRDCDINMISKKWNTLDLLSIGTYSEPDPVEKRFMLLMMFSLIMEDYHMTDDMPI